MYTFRALPPTGTGGDAGELVESTKQEEFSVPEEAKNFSFHQKEEKVSAMDGDAILYQRTWQISGRGSGNSETLPVGPAGGCTLLHL